MRILVVKKGQNIVEPTASFTNMPINALFAAHPTPPVQPAVGNAPIGFLTAPAFPAAKFIRSQFAGYALGGPLSRADVRAICTNRFIEPLAAYAVAMAWGEQRDDHFAVSISSSALPVLLEELRTSKNSREHDFGVTAAAGIDGLGIAFYTKLLYFFRPAADAYILDQWTAKSAHLLFSPAPMRLGSPGEDGYYGPHPATTPKEYEAFCASLDGLGATLWRGSGAIGENAEAAMFDVGRGRGLWRNFVKPHFAQREIGENLRKGWICCTTAQDFDDGWLVLKIDKKVVVFVTAIKGGERGLRVLLARLRELGATEVVFPTGNGSVSLPDRFVQGCNALGVRISGGRNADGGHGGGGPTAPNRNPGNDGNQDVGGGEFIRHEVAPTQNVPQIPADGPEGEMKPQPLRKLIVDGHHRAGLPNQLRHEGNPARITFTARPNAGNATIRWQYLIGARTVGFNLFFSYDHLSFDAVEAEIKAHPDPMMVGGGIEFNRGATYNVSRQSIPIDPANLPATAAACVNAMKDFYDQLRASSQTIGGW